MDIKVNNNLAFNARLVTPIKGRNNIMKPVAEKFEQLTQNIPGELNIKRANDFGNPHLMEISYKNASYVTTDLQEYMSKPADNKNIRDLAVKLSNCLKALKQEATYKEKLWAINRKIYDYRTSIRHLEKTKAEAQNNNFLGLLEYFQGTIDKHKSIIDNLEKQKIKLKDRTIKNVNVYKDKGIGLDVYADVLEDEMKTAF